MKKISVILPVYNSEKYISKCLDSLISQTYKSIEVIVINDGSIDNSLKIINDYVKKNTNIKVINKKNEGVSIARRVGLNVVTGDYITFIDSDDFIDEKMYEQMIKVALQNNADIVECGYIFHDENNTVINIKGLKKTKMIGQEECLRNFLTGNNSENFLWNKIYKRELFKNLDTGNYSFSEDFLWNVILHDRCKKKITLEETYYHYLKNMSGACNSGNIKKKLEGIGAAKEALQYMENNNSSFVPYIIKYLLDYIICIYKENKNSGGQEQKYKSIILKEYKDNLNVKKLKKIVTLRKVYLYKLFDKFPSIYCFLEKVKSRIVVIK